ncbi:PRC-barrel domain-containing protein [Massilia pinisoli]|uniref:PRC-barrel domain-containing protein n=1 Tax=Massilia pinisoli TaxID=1772194 RepID=A0ABT1ZNH7_9BURK|nr:PRC-barrel domain-containing protein [Massilia pinisoli]MCS0581466.1 PRC-barrel domain-containing protein [Massilia pinisoli]
MSYADRDKYGMYKATHTRAGHAGPGPALMGADTLIGDSVVNAADEDLGDIKEIMLDMQTGQVAYAVLSFGGFLGMGDKLFAVPWQALHLDTVNKRFVLDIDKNQMQNAPGFDKNAWPDLADAQWAQHIHSFYGTDPTRAGAPTMGPNVAMRGMVGGGTGVGAGMGSMGAGHAGSVDTGMGAGSSMSGGSAGGGAGGSLDPRPGNAGGDKDLSKIRGSNLG